MSDTHKGRCFCGAVTFEVTGAPISEGYCHCEDCRAWSAGPVTAYALWPADAVRITAGEDKLVTYSKTGSTHRRICAVCGGSIMADLPGLGLTDLFPTLLEGRDFAPRAHVHYAKRIMDVPDGLPKFADMPEEGGGTGKMISD